MKGRANASTFGIDVTSPNNLPQMRVETLLFEVVPITVHKIKVKAICSLDPDVKYVSKSMKKFVSRKV